ncbi:MAG: TIGR04282 family arsenosugar biosynthesis glycosyltransferase [gamma proteobacterium symbiont of Bathyaustriella thionipta]|nr:TIGR04282 family arsenosugar biosynthesis glycosyltransferase [gamma proteobacterium symbiont of Bathyaustriella thionipta]MCU7950931.1 TIGR04282 family arsenosugar biosynthesis glycosyltransferase [gamma proteobacterium symbiont of Bathyaustriella thionipta]MCU7952742.1 TIGR04282 family arsenosugar biosynthesis glycosyltransferase [gamma proteobacterium symbiont of Bathyaustriella thionipta]MCU7957422.1 TIGR04282 family arsenosugar biosynthesis glycosyltransferase [gamma proteobacterium symb
MKSQRFCHSDTLIIIFAREPVIGQVKTRLIPALGKEGATKLYKQLSDYVINNVITYNLSPLSLCITPESCMAYFTKMASSSHFNVSLQTGNDLGARMYNALALALKNYSKAILIGTDCPFLKLDDLQQAISALDKNDMVFSPAKDGGYVLVGAKKVTPAVFKQIDWGTEQVMAQTRKALLNHNVSWRELSEQHDIDVDSDLKYLMLIHDFKYILPVK